jgi:hypothetical protein
VILAILFSALPSIVIAGFIPVNYRGARAVLD